MGLLVGIFLVLHGLVHLLYAGQSRRFFELRPGMTWPDDCWSFSKLLGNQTTRNLSAILLTLAALGFIAGGLGLTFHQDWWQKATIGAAVFSSAIFILLWDGKIQALAEKGGVGVSINLILLAIILAFA